MGAAATVGFARNLIFAYYLEPVNMGYYSMAITISSYGVFLQLGLLHGLNRELPVRYGKQEFKNADYLLSSAKIALDRLHLVSLIIYFALVFFIPFEDVTKKESFYLAGLIVIPNQLLMLVMLCLRTKQRVIEYASFQFMKDVLLVFMGILLIQYLEQKGAVLAIVLINLGVYFFIKEFFLPPFDYSYSNREYILYLLKIGFPIMISGVFINLYLTMDRLFLFYATSAEILGIYQIALLPLIGAILINSFAVQYFFPKLLFSYGKGKSLNYLFKYALKVTFLIMLIMVCIAPIFLNIISFIINNYLPLYVDSLDLMPIFYISAILIAGNLMEIVIIAINKPFFSVLENVFIALVAVIVYLSMYQNLLWYAYTVLIIQLTKFVVSICLSYFLQKKYSVS